nr:glycoside hydrolase family 16 protein [uncultured Cellulosilyticum sp.]
MKSYVAFIGMSLILIGCSNAQAPQKIESMQTSKLLEEEITVSRGMKNLKGTVALETQFNDFEETLMEKANGWTNGSMFDCTWRSDNVQFQDGNMMLTIDQDGENTSPKWSGGEYRTRQAFHYGMYEVRMKPIKNTGVVSSFFTYTGPSDNNPWDEIDIEFLGKDSTKVQFNYFTNGVGEHEYVYDLGFDASEAFHEYAFEWQPDSITWYVDGVEVYKATENIPQTPSKVMMNTWPGIGVDSWLGAFDGKTPLTAEYDWMRVTQYSNK